MQAGLPPPSTPPGTVCWVDLAAPDLPGAIAFYERLFGWSAVPAKANGGTYSQLRMGGLAVGSMYQLGARQMHAGVPSHWLPYVVVDDVDEAARQAVALGGRLLVSPQDVPGMTRFCVVCDPGGAQIGLWQPTAANHG